MICSFLRVIFALFLLASSASAQAIRLQPAVPQPEAASLAPGLAVRYAYGGDIKFLSDAKIALRFSSEAGPPLVGFDYPDRYSGAKVLTSKKKKQVAARISGYIRFDEAGPRTLRIQSNDGISIRIGGERVDVYDGRRTCASGGPVEVMIPAPGWYELTALYFQRVKSSCLLMRWGAADGDLTPTPNEVFAHKR